jgi:hypothetical protein
LAARRLDWFDVETQALKRAHHEGTTVELVAQRRMGTRNTAAAVDDVTVGTDTLGQALGLSRAPRAATRLPCRPAAI